MTKEEKARAEVIKQRVAMMLNALDGLSLPDAEVVIDRAGAILEEEKFRMLESTKVKVASPERVHFS